MTGLEPLIPIFFFLSVASEIILRGPLGKALADRLSGHAAAEDPSEAAALKAELDDVYHRLEDLEQRLDFAERLLVKGREREGLPGGG
jgi:hypothetical protein